MNFDETTWGLIMSSTSEYAQYNHDTGFRVERYCKDAKAWVPHVHTGTAADAAHEFENALQYDSREKYRLSSKAADESRKVWRYWPGMPTVGRVDPIAGKEELFAQDYEEVFGTIPRSRWEVADKILAAIRTAVSDTLKEQGMDRHEWNQFGRRYMDFRATDAAVVSGLHDYSRWLSAGANDVAKDKPERCTSTYDRLPDGWKGPDVPQ